MALFGEYRQSLDARRRVALPRGLRDAIAEEELRQGLVLTPGFESCLFLFPISNWNVFAASFSSVLLGGPEGRALARLLLGQAVCVEVDRQGRIRLPDFLRERAGVTDEAVLVGASTRIEIWSPERWETLKQSAEGRLEELAASFSSLWRGRAAP